MTYSRSDVYLSGMILIGLLQILVVWILYPFGVFNMVIGYICVYFLVFFLALFSEGRVADKINIYM